jgi:hypothetical protein
MHHRLLVVCISLTCLCIAACGGGNDGGGTAAITEFDPNNRDRAAFWWANLVQKVIEAKATENQILIDEAMKEVTAAVQPLAGQRIQFKFGVFPANPDLPETVWNYKPISAEGVWVGLVHRANPGRIRVGVPVHNRNGPRAFLLKSGEHLDPAILRDLKMSSTFEISATVTHTAFERFDSWHQGTKSFSDTPTLAIYLNQIKVEKVNP